MVTNAELRARARAALRGNWGMAILAVVIMILITGAVQMIPMIGSVISILLTGAFTLGLYGYFLRLVRAGNSSIEELFNGFKQFGQAFLLYLLMSIFILLWSILLIVPGIIAYYRYSQAYFIMKDNPGIPALEAIRRSKEMMVGYKANLFLLHLSFIGWFLLCIVTVGIGFLFLSPYVYTSQACFYEELLGTPAFPSDNAF